MATTTDSVSAALTTHKVGIVFSATSSAKYFDATAYSELFRAAQEQAQAAGVPFDILTEADLTNVSKLAQYSTLIFPSFQNVPLASYQAIESALKTVTQQYHVGLITAGNFMTNDENGNALPGNSYERMQSLFGATYQGSTSSPGAVHVAASNVTDPAMAGYTAGETIRDYTNMATQWFTATGPNATVLATQAVGGQTYNAVLATQTGGRNVLFANESFLGDNNMLQHAISSIDAGQGPSLKLEMTRQAELFASRTDIDLANDYAAVNPGAGQKGLYDLMLPTIQQWKQQFNFVGSFYLDIGNNPPTEYTDWSVTKPYLTQLMGLGNEIGSHTITHPEDTNTLTDAQIQTEFQDSKSIIETNLGIKISGAAVPGMPDKLADSQRMIKYYDYLTGGNSQVGAGYPDAFGYLTPPTAADPNSSKIYIAPNISSDFTEIGWLKQTAAQAEVNWANEYAAVRAHADLPIIVWPWHDYGLTG